MNQDNKIDCDLYTSLEEAKEEIWRRWNDRALREKVAAFVGNIPDHLLNEPRAVLDKNIATFNIECSRFIALAAQSSLSPIIWEYLDDKFVDCNADKLGLGKMAFLQGRNRNNQPIIKYQTVIRVEDCNGNQLRDIETLWGESFVRFHHHLLTQSPFDGDLFDCSAWFALKGGRAKEYYSYFLALFICHGILFENFIAEKGNGEEYFSKTIVIPAFRSVLDHFGLKPLIVPLVPHSEAADKFWRCYPPELESIVLHTLARKNGSRRSISEITK